MRPVPGGIRHDGVALVVGRKAGRLVGRPPVATGALIVRDPAPTATHASSVEHVAAYTHLGDGAPCTDRLVAYGAAKG
jgi:hypothetical protein